MTELLTGTGLAMALIEWEQKRKALDALEEIIRASVLAIGQTQTVGDVRASYSSGRKSYDYEAAVLNNDDINEAAIEQFTTETVVTKTDWRALCKWAGLEEIPFTQGEPSVTIKLLEK